MNKFGYVITLIIGVGAMLVIPSPIGHFAKASTCSVSSPNMAVRFFAALQLQEDVQAGAPSARLD